MKNLSNSFDTYLKLAVVAFIAFWAMFAIRESGPKPYYADVNDVYSAEVRRLNGGTFVVLRPYNRVTAPIPATALIGNWAEGPTKVLFQPELKVGADELLRLQEAAYALMTPVVIEARLATK